MRYMLNSAKASPSNPTGISKRSPPAKMKHKISAGSAITKRIVASTFVRLHAILNTRPNTLINSQTNRIVQSMRAYLADATEIYDTPLTVYQCNSIEDVCIASLHFLIVNQYNIRKCTNCGRYFVAYLRSDAEYCTRVSPYNKKKTCREDGPKRTFEASINADVVKKTLKQIESARRMRKHRNPDNWDIQTEFDEWHTAMVRWRKNYQSGGISAEQLLAWLEEHRSYTEDWDYEENYI